MKTLKFGLICFLLLSCVDADLKFNFKSAIGIYTSDVKNAKEFLELKNDSTYFYSIKYKDGKTNTRNGRWYLRIANEHEYWKDFDVVFENWPIEIDPRELFYSSLEQNKTELKNDISTVDFGSLIGIKNFKTAYVIRRDMELHEYDFYKFVKEK